MDNYYCYVFIFTGGFADTGVSTTTMEKWALHQVAPLFTAGWKPEQLLAYAIADEPSFGIPMNSPASPMNLSSKVIIAEWMRYVQSKNLTPTDFGAASWSLVSLSRQRRPTNLSGKRLFYHSMRFLEHASTLLFARSTTAMEVAWNHTGLPTFANFNLKSGRFYTAGATSNAPALVKKDENAAELGNDWFQFARNGATNLMWTEDCELSVLWHASTGTWL